MSKSTVASVAILLPAYNEEEKLLRQSIESMLSQTWHDFRLYFILDNPLNQKAITLGHEYAEQDARFAFVQNERNLGLVNSLNRIIRQTSEPLIARMDADDIALPTRLDAELALMEKYDLDFSMSAASIIKPDGETIQGRKLPLLLPDAVAEATKHTNISIHSTWLLKRVVYERLGGYRQINYCEDLDFLMRAIQAGFRVGRHPDSLLAYRLRSDSISQSYTYEQGTRARFLHKRYSHGDRIVDLDPESVNARFRGTDAQIEHSSSARLALANLGIELNRRHYLKCICIAGSNLVANSFFAPELIRSIRERFALNAVCRKYASRPLD